MQHDQGTVFVGRIVTVGPFEAADARLVGDLRIRRRGIEEKHTGILHDRLHRERHRARYVADDEINLVLVDETAGCGDTLDRRALAVTGQDVDLAPADCRRRR
ncbi:hypothetical protein BRDID11002_12090 [Bradyrhizobium diazoefficiens]